MTKNNNITKTLQETIVLFAVFVVQEQREQLRREKSLPLLSSRYQTRSSYGRGENRAQSDRRNKQRVRRSRSAKTPKRQTDSVDPNLVSSHSYRYTRTSCAAR